MISDYQVVYQMIEKAVQAERERCADIADKHMNNIKIIANRTAHISAAAFHIATEIRRTPNEKEEQVQTKGRVTKHNGVGNKRVAAIHIK